MSQVPEGRGGWVEQSARVTLVDDEQLNMDVLQIHLEAEGYTQFTCIADSRTVMQRLEADPPDVLLLDLMMPHVSGFDILGELGGHPTLSEIPVIVLTSSNDAETKLRALRLGATDFLAKPVDSSELALRMRNTLTARAWQTRKNRIDPLTELPNRACLFGVLNRELREATVAGEERQMPPVSPGLLALVNIQQFKSINDSLGTEQGDRVLWTVRERLVATFGRNPGEVFDALSLGPGRCEACCIARLGSDRFVVYMPECCDGHDERRLIALVEQFLDSLAEPIVLAKERVYVRASIGVARLIYDGERVPDVLNAAESAMRQASGAGGTGYAFYSAEMNSPARERLAMETSLRTAVVDGDLFLVYQPKLDVASDTITGAEALVRWRHPELGLVSPVDFIPMAEHSGMIVSIGEWVMREACTQAALWRRTRLPTLCIAVNVSIRQLQEQDFIATVRRVLEETELAPEALIIELTENMVMENAETNVAKLEQLRAIGVRVSIDDFGTGYSSLAYLQRFAIDQLKIDQSFIKEIDDGSTTAPIVKAVISLAHDLGLSVVAEGVEERHQLTLLQSLACEEYQGYLASRPVVGPEFETLLAADRSTDLAA